MTRFEFWKHRSGDTYAVKVVSGDVVGTIGPLHHTEIKPMLLPGYRYTKTDVAWIKKHRHEFELDLSIAGG